MPPKKKQKLYLSLAEQQQLLEDFYQSLDDETFLGYEFCGEGEDKEMFLALLQTPMLIYLIKILTVLHNQLMRKT